MRRHLLTLFLIWNSSIFGQATASFTASVTIIEPVSISTQTNMNFASISSISGGEVILNPDDIRSSNGGIKLEESEGVSSAKFLIKGQKGLTVSITLPKNSFPLSNGNEIISLHSFTSNLPESFQLGESPVFLKVGATIELDKAQSPGIYNSVSPLNVMINYN